MNIVEKAKDFAIAKHANQKYGDRPYSYHLAQVSQVLSEFGYLSDEAIAAAAWLHDTLEDTETTYTELVSEFGHEISDIVFAVTNEPGENRAAKFRKTALKIQSHKKALIVKLADRIANTEASLETNRKLYKMYNKEFPLFKELLYTDDANLLPVWNRLIKAST
ncbi:HD domain-containing protein [Microcoleus sp. A006_D1]|uniref:HD domain-containing protein n=1 Tax=Microcoleus sp. A006_D1 TaxID=3055267 RepID=UPI002FD32AD5